MTKDTARASTQPAPLGKPGGPGLFHKKGQGLPVYVENIRNALIRKGMSESHATATAIATVKRLALTSKDPAVKAAAAKAVAQWEKAKAASHVHASVELATPHDGHHQAGLVIYRYKHGWILLHPEVLSRGHHGGAHAATIHHKSGGTTVGHFEHGGAGGHGPTHAKFIPDKHLGPGEDYTPYLKGAAPHTPKEGELEAAQAHLDAQHGENLSKLKKVAQEAHLKALEPFATSYMHQNAIDALGAVIDEAGPGHKDAITAAKAALKHQDMKHKSPDAQFVKSDAHQAAMASSKFAFSENTASAHQSAALAHHNAMLKAGNMHADAWANVHASTEGQHTAEVADLKQKDAAKLSLKASIATADANKNGTPEAHLAAQVAHSEAAQKHFELDNHDAVSFHDKQVALHAKYVKVLGSQSDNAPSYPKYKNAAMEATEKANLSGFKEDHLAAMNAHEAAKAKTAKGSAEFKKHNAQVALHGMASAGAPWANTGDPFDLSPDAGLMGEFKASNDQFAEDKKMSDLFKNLQAANASGSKIASSAALNDMIKAQQEYQKKHGKTWNAAESAAAKATPSGGIDSGAEVSAPGATDYTKLYSGAADAGFTAVRKGESANGDWHPSNELMGGGIEDYSGNAYTAINAQLRKGIIDEYADVDGIIARADQQFIASPPLDHGIVVNRWLGTGSMFGPVPPGAQPGDEFTDLAYGSTSKDPAIWKDNNGAQVQVRIPAGFKALDLNHTVGSLNPQEAEVTLPRGTTYRVVSDQGTVPNRKIIVEVVAQDPKGSVAA